MDDQNHVFARFKDDKPATAERRERLTIPGRGGASTSRSVEVVHLRPRAAPTAKDRTRQGGHHGPVASWADTLPPTPATPAPAAVEPDLVQAPKPVIHVMPAWEPSGAATEAAAPVEVSARVDTAVLLVAGKRSRPTKPARRVADPFDTADDGTNCLRCGYAIEPAREQRGLMTCAGCG